MHVLLIDDHPIVRHGIRTLLETQPDITVVADTDAQADLPTLLHQSHPGVVLLDLDLGAQTRGVDLISDIRAGCGAHVLMFSAYETDADVALAVQAGAVGWLNKDASPSEIFASLRAAHAGIGVWRTNALRRISGINPDPHVLTPREIDVLRLLALGLSNRQLSQRLFVSEATVKTHLHHIFRKLGAESRANALSIAVQRSLIRIS